MVCVLFLLNAGSHYFPEKSVDDFNGYCSAMVVLCCLLLCTSQHCIHVIYVFVIMLVVDRCHGVVVELEPRILPIVLTPQGHIAQKTIDLLRGSTVCGGAKQ